MTFTFAYSGAIPIISYTLDVAEEADGEELRAISCLLIDL